MCHYYPIIIMLTYSYRSLITSHSHIHGICPQMKHDENHYYPTIDREYYPLANKHRP